MEAGDYGAYPVPAFAGISANNMRHKNNPNDAYDYYSQGESRGNQLSPSAYQSLALNNIRKKRSHNEVTFVGLPVLLYASPLILIILLLYRTYIAFLFI